MKWDIIQNVIFLIGCGFFATGTIIGLLRSLGKL